MSRWLFEFEDLSWFPDTLRSSMVDYLSFFLRKTDYYKPVIPLIKTVLERSGAIAIVDICSGGGGPVIRIAAGLEQQLGYPVPITLTDKFPNMAAYKEWAQQNSSIGYSTSSVDATDVPAHLKGLRTCFSAFHHFDRQTGIQLVQDAIQQKAAVAVFDGGDKNLLTILGIILLHPLVFLLCTPFLKPFRFSRLFFTYCIPLIPFCTVWDGVVSITRLRSPAQLLQLATAADPKGYYTWESGIKRHPLGFGIAYLTGYPK